MLLQICVREACKKAFPSYQNEKRFCSRECAYEERREKLRVTLTCSRCQKLFRVKKSRLSRYCSRECRSALPELRCVVCNDVFRRSGGGKFCSKECERENGRVAVSCAGCGKEIIRARWEVRQRNYCNSQCRVVAIKHSCLHCSTEFDVLPKHVERGEGKFCSAQCSILHKRKTVQRTCQGCSKEFEIPLSDVERGRGKFCSKECRASLVALTCSRCQKEFTRSAHLAKAQQPYCSAACVKDLRSRTLIAECRARVVLDRKTWKPRGMYNWEIAEEVGCTEKLVRRVLKELGMQKKRGQPTVYKRPELPRPDPRKPWLNSKDVSEI